MSDEMKVVACTGCGTRLKVKSSAQRVKCGKCSTSFEVSAATASPKRLQPETANSQSSPTSQIPGPTMGVAESLGFFAYVWRSYHRTHSTLPFMLAMILSLLLMPVLSFLKPKIGVTAVIWSFGITLGVSLGLFVVLVVISSSRFLFMKKRTIGEDQRSWLSAFICFLGMLSPALGIVAAAESFSPAEGLFVKLVPQFKAEQTRLLGEITDSAGEDSSESSDANSQIVSTDSASTTQSETADSDGGSDEVALADTKPSGRAKQAKSKSDSSHDDGDQEAEPPQKKTAQKSKTSNSKAASSDSDPKTKQVVAEGVGATKSDAEKDAFRNAVKQVVGAVVDAETLIKNDEVIEDKVLTYSDGFIKKGWETLSEKTQGGLVRIKIKVQVEQRSVVAKLKAANVTTKQVDGKGLFAEVVTQLDAEKDAQALIEKALKGFPLNCLKAEVVGKPELLTRNDSTAAIKITFTVAADLAAYDAFSQRLEAILKGIAKQQTDFTINAKAIVEKDEEDRRPAREPGGNQSAGEDGYVLRAYDVTSTEGAWPSLIPQLKTWLNATQLSPYSLKDKSDSDPVCVAINLQRTRNLDRSEWKCFLLDSSTRQSLAAVCACVFTAKLSLLDDEGRTLTVERVPLALLRRSEFDYYATCVCTGISSEHIFYTGRDQKVNGGFQDHYFETIAGHNNDKKREVFFLVSPFFWHRRFLSMDYRTTLTFTPTLTLSLDELKAVDSIKCEVMFDGDLPPKITSKRK